jgi:hypothetical protein
MLIQLQKLFANLKLSVMRSVDPTGFVKTYRDMVCDIIEIWYINIAIIWDMVLTIAIIWDMVY